jgi:hypothetical protein
VVSRRSRRSNPPDPFAVLGIPPGAGADEVAEARRRLARQSHPDVGGSLEAMQRINEAADRALAAIGRAGGANASPSTVASPSPSPSRGGAGAGTQRRQRSPVRVDHPSFTIEVLPAEAYEGLLVVASWLGDVIHDEPPYGLEVALVDPVRGWCRLDVTPDAGASTVSIAVAAEPGHPAPDVEVVRDVWIDGLNQLDWSGTDGPCRPQPPS